MSGRYAAELAEGEVVVEVATDYPWDGTVTVRIASAPYGPWELALLFSVDIPTCGMPRSNEFPAGSGEASSPRR
jgi:hypothetical protein